MLFAAGAVLLCCTMYAAIPDAFSPVFAVSVPVNVMLFVVVLDTLATGFCVSILSTFPDAAAPICPSLSISTAYTVLFVLTVIPVLAFAHPNAVCLLAPTGLLSVIFNV